MRQFALCVAIVVSCVGQGRAGTITFSDGTFNDSDWTSVIQQWGNGGSVITTPVASGGSPGAYLQVVTSVNGGPPESTVVGAFFRVGAAYDPSAQGAITGIDYSESDKMFIGSGDGQGAGAAVRQGGLVYCALDPAARFYAVTPTWTSNSVSNLQASAFLVLGVPGSHPDFSATGGPIDFEFYRANSLPSYGSAYSITAGLDNWSVTINQIPEPSAAVGLISMATIGLIVCWHRRRKA